MARFLIEVPHSANGLECARAIAMFLRAGSHYLTHADWGCKDGDHRSWIIADVTDRDEARLIVPAPFRSVATIVQLNRFDLQEIEAILSRHGG